MSQHYRFQPVLLGKLNERQIARALLQQGPLSRADLARLTGLTAPTISKAVDSLLASGYLEEQDPAAAFGRPAKRLALAAREAQVLGLVIDAGQCRMVAAGLDGQIRAADTRTFPTPETYEALIEQTVHHARLLMQREQVSTLGLGVSLPGLVDYRQKQALLSPNVPITNGQRPGVDLARALGIECALVQEEHALCMAERSFGSARGLDDFAMLDVSTGVGLGVMSGGRILLGRSGLAGEIGHITVDIRGRRCGCGNHGCLETVACDSALAWQISRKRGRGVTIEEILELKQQGEEFHEEVEALADYLSVGLAAVINLFNPSSLFVHGRLFEMEEGLFPRIVERARSRTLAPSFADCKIIRARGSKRQGAVAAIIERLLDGLVPTHASQEGLPHREADLSAAFLDVRGV